MTGLLSGVFIVAVTPLDKNRALDPESYERLMKYCRDAEVDGLTALGDSAERESLTSGEKERILEATFRAAGGDLPVVVGTGAEDLSATVEQSRSAESLGAAAVMVPPPRRLSAGGAAAEAEIFDFYSAVGDAVTIPVVVQDFPQQGRPKMPVPLLSRISSEVRNAEYLKLEDPPTPVKLDRVREATKGMMKVFSALYGRDSYWDLAHGAVGVMTSCPTPEYLVAMYGAFKSGDRRRALDIYLATLPLVHFGSELGLAVRKEVLVQRGVLSTGMMKSPEKELPQPLKAELGEVLAWVESRVLALAGVSPLRPSRPA
jgi:dihydrodipicolinate synthase/N-acetylneuraminate lyase